MSNSESPSVYKGACFCGLVSYAVTARPLLSAYCHCTRCQRLHASPFLHTMHFPASSFTWTHPQPHKIHLDSFQDAVKPWKKRWRCKNCGSNVASYNEKTDRWSAWGALMERDDEGRIKNWEALKPTAHTFYSTRMLDVDDGLTKWEGYENESARIQ